ncbi:hypothetical protein N9L68_04730 [bacterium]|nr:hypothetical protein [bacterium]
MKVIRRARASVNHHSPKYVESCFGPHQGLVMKGMPDNIYQSHGMGKWDKSPDEEEVLIRAAKLGRNVDDNDDQSGMLVALDDALPTKRNRVTRASAVDPNGSDEQIEGDDVDDNEEDEEASEEDEYDEQYTPRREEEEEEGGHPDNTKPRLTQCHEKRGNAPQIPDKSRTDVFSAEAEPGSARAPALTVPPTATKRAPASSASRQGKTIGHWIQALPLDDMCDDSQSKTAHA